MPMNRRRRLRRTIKGPGPRTLAVGAALALVAAGAGGFAAYQNAVPGPQVRLTGGPLPVAIPIAPPAPKALQDELDALVRAYGEEVGVAVTDVSEGWTAGVDAESFYPQQSVSKLWVAIAVLKAADEGRLSVDQPVLLGEEDRSVFFQPVSYSIGPNGYRTEVSGLLRRAIVQSDNAANDRLIKEAGGPAAVGATLERLNLEGVSVGAYERDLQARVAGLTWRPEYGTGWNFQAAREQLPREVREAALEAYLDDPLDGAKPAAITRALARLHKGELLSPASTERLLGLLQDVRTGPRRLKGGLPPGWAIGHKTGTGQDYGGASVGINDVGLLTAPDGRTYAVAVMMRRTHKPVPQRLELMQAVTRTVTAHWARTRADGAVQAD
ncbi:serine hydrolase [Phenylobacterium sp. VNQ135]|uniref:serine hydrolase n=1 Tax=Phenylobacterium sp. VNQ135 TaxID=3400922 RepID=UPI003C08020F